MHALALLHDGVILLFSMHSCGVAMVCLSGAVRDIFFIPRDSMENYYAIHIQTTCLTRSHVVGLVRIGKCSYVDLVLFGPQPQVVKY